MSDTVQIGLRRVLPIGDGEYVRAVVVRELTLAQFRQWLADAATERPRDWLHVLLHEERDASDLPVFTDLDADALEHLTPSQIRRVWREAEELNADFFVALGRLEEGSRPGASSQTSSAPQ